MLEESSAPRNGAATAALSIRVEPEEMRRASAWLDAFCRENAVPAKRIGHLDLCLNEALANVHMHGGQAARSAPVELHLEICRVDPGGEAALRIADAGPPFDPLAADIKAHPRSLAEAEIGGLGIEMLRKFSDRISYQRGDGRNHLVIVVSWDAPAQAAGIS